MNRNEQFLSLIGLCLRGRNLEVGEEPVEAVARARDARVLLLASDAADNTARRVQHFAEAGQCVWLRIPFTKQELGQATGRGSAAVAAITDIGLAVAVVRRLAEMDPEKYDEDLAKLELKAKRAAERKSEAVQHEKNLRRGIKRPKKQEVPDEKGAGPAGVSGKPSGEKQRRSAGVSDKRAEKAGPRRTAENGGAAKSFAKDDRTGRPLPQRGARPSRASTTALLVSFRASSMVLPLMRSVAMLLVAMAAPQPKVRNLTSTITLFSIFRYMRMMSPHLGLPTSPTPFASGSSPTLCGFAKCSMTLALYILAIITALPSG